MNMFNTKNRKGEIKISREEFDKLFKMAYNELNDFIEFDIENKILHERIKKGSSTTAFVRIPNDILENKISSDDEKMSFLLEIMLFTYGLRHKHIRYTIDEIYDLFYIIGMKKSEFVKQYCDRKIGNIIMVHKRGKGVFISFAETEDIISHESKTCYIEDFNIDNYNLHSLNSYINDMIDNYDELTKVQFKIKEKISSGYYEYSDIYNFVTQRIVKLKRDMEFSLPF